jgi:outer membrane lipoprotein SlyB
MDLSREYPLQRHGLLYPLMVIAAIAVIVFSIVGIVAISGWMPTAMVGAAPAVGTVPESGVTQSSRTAIPAESKAAPAFPCAECGVIKSIREIEQDGAVESASLVSAAPQIAAAQHTGL